MLKHCPNIQGYHYCDCKDDCQIRKELNMAQQTAVEWFYQRILAEDIKAVFEQAKAMEKQQIRDALILFCDTESYGACDIKDWVKNNGIIFKNKDTNSQIVDRVDYFVDNILNHNI